MTVGQSSFIHVPGTSHNQFTSVSYVAVKTAVPDGAAHDYDEIITSGEVCVSEKRRTDGLVLSTASVSSHNEYCGTPHTERKNFQVAITVRVME